MRSFKSEYAPLRMGKKTNSQPSSAKTWATCGNKELPKVLYIVPWKSVERFDMQAQDVIFVDTAGVSEWNRVISQLLPSISIIGIADSIGTN